MLGTDTYRSFMNMINLSALAGKSHVQGFTSKVNQSHKRLQFFRAETAFWLVEKDPVNIIDYYSLTTWTNTLHIIRFWMMDFNWILSTGISYLFDNCSTKVGNNAKRGALRCQWKHKGVELIISSDCFLIAWSISFSVKKQWISDIQICHHKSDLGCEIF